MEVLSLETLEEATKFLQLCLKNDKLFEQYTHVGGLTTVGKSLDKWYWANSGKLIDYALKFLPGQPDFYGYNEYCLGISKSADAFSFIDVACFGTYELKFICQKLDI